MAGPMVRLCMPTEKQMQSFISLLALFALPLFSCTDEPTSRPTHAQHCTSGVKECPGAFVEDIGNQQVRLVAPCDAEQFVTLRLGPSNDAYTGLVGADGFLVVDDVRQTSYPLGTNASFECDCNGEPLGLVVAVQ